MKSFLPIDPRWCLAGVAVFLLTGCNDDNDGSGSGGGNASDIEGVWQVQVEFDELDGKSTRSLVGNIVENEEGVIVFQRCCHNGVDEFTLENGLFSNVTNTRMLTVQGDYESVEITQQLEFNSDGSLGGYYKVDGSSFDIESAYTGERISQDALTSHGSITVQKDGETIQYDLGVEGFVSHIQGINTGSESTPSSSTVVVLAYDSTSPLPITSLGIFFHEVFSFEPQSYDIESLWEQDKLNMLSITLEGQTLNLVSGELVVTEVTSSTVELNVDGKTEDDVSISMNVKLEHLDFAEYRSPEAVEALKLGDL